MNYTCFFCGRATRENGDICATCDRKISSPSATGLRTRAGQRHYRDSTWVSVTSPDGEPTLKKKSGGGLDKGSG